MQAVCRKPSYLHDSLVDLFAFFVNDGRQVVETFLLFYEFIFLKYLLISMPYFLSAGLGRLSALPLAAGLLVCLRVLK